MKKLFYLLMVLFVASSYGQSKPEYSTYVNVVKNGMVTTTVRDAYVVPAGEAWYLTTTDGEKWKNIGGAGWVSDAGGAGGSDGLGANGDKGFFNVTGPNTAVLKTQGVKLTNLNTFPSSSEGQVLAVAPSSSLYDMEWIDLPTGSGSLPTAGYGLAYSGTTLSVDAQQTSKVYNLPLDTNLNPTATFINSEIANRIWAEYGSNENKTVNLPSGLETGMVLYFSVVDGAANSFITVNFAEANSPDFTLTSGQMAMVIKSNNSNFNWHVLKSGTSTGGTGLTSDQIAFFNNFGKHFYQFHTTNFTWSEANSMIRTGSSTGKRVINTVTGNNDVTATISNLDSGTGQNGFFKSKSETAIFKALPATGASFTFNDEPITGGLQIIGKGSMEFTEVTNGVMDFIGEGVTEYNPITYTQLYPSDYISNPEVTNASIAGGWVGYNARASYVGSTVNPSNGLWALRATPDGEPSNYISYRFEVVSGASYIISFDAMAADGSGSYFYLGNNFTGQADLNLNVGTYNSESVTAVASGTGTGEFRFYLGTATHIDIDNFSILRINE